MMANREDITDDEIDILKHGLRRLLDGKPWFVAGNKEIKVTLTELCNANLLTARKAGATWDDLEYSLSDHGKWAICEWVIHNA
jgi:hypothetical protein